jgi:predicted MFS family arabinose efflux permease
VGAAIPRKELVRAIDRPASVWALLIGTAITETILLVLPSFVGALADDLKLSAQRVGLLGSADLIGVALSTASGPFWVRRVSWRRAVLAALLTSLVCNIVCFGIRGFAPLMGVRIIAGLAAGVGYAVGLAGITDTIKPAQNAGLLLGVEVVLSAIGVYVLDAVPQAWRLDAVYAYVLVWLVPYLPVAFYRFPEDPGERNQVAALDWRRIALRGSLVMVGAGLYFVMIGGVWGYLEGIAREAGMTLRETGQALSVGLVVSLLGALMASVLGLRWGRTVPLLLSGIAQTIALYLLTRLHQFRDVVLAFYVINAVFQIMWSYIVPYFIVMFAEVEPSGRFVTLFGMAMHLALAIGPYAGAFFIIDGHHNPLLRLGIVLAVLCYASFLAAVWVGRATASPVSAVRATE